MLRNLDIVEISDRRLEGLSPSKRHRNNRMDGLWNPAMQRQRTFHADIAWSIDEICKDIATDGMTPVLWRKTVKTSPYV